ncbi:2'-5' RNA ligase family protein [Erythrobacter rubeus]|uniref:2'-5' RNA ligase family protein n=1 Tax=Erythrobacter rubeus TaxID=2760803 RepID=A0ABR8KNC7_9SPHN|nr:2'-5' RNA ligase family protein [Erythrobacter rubeus]MBD2842147.1 2'-5' RNA ligase family protein [Erythrobacter rubeus]
MAQPFIVTAKLPPDMHNWADALRRKHFPPERNHLHAHVTMFHAFAPSLLGELCDFLPRVAREFAPPKARVIGLMNLGKGTAIRLESPELLSLRAMIADHFHGSLTEQDLHEPRPHITIQNKVTRKEAQALQSELEPQIEERDFVFPALELHRYLGGPWEAVKRMPFRGKARP